MLPSKRVQWLWHDSWQQSEEKKKKKGEREVNEVCQLHIECRIRTPACTGAHTHQKKKKREKLHGWKISRTFYYYESKVKYQRKVAKI